MRTDNRFLVLSTLGGLLTAASCTLITDVDRTKIPVDGGAEGGQGANGGKGGASGNAGRGGKGGTGGSAGSTGGSMGGEGGGEAGGSTGGAGGTMGGTSGSSGNAGTSGSPATGGTGGTSGTGGDAGAGGEAGGTSAECGNGVVESGEVCDDGNVNACGTCAANCAATRAIPASADGSIVIGAMTFIMDEDTFTLDDGTNTVVFEFDCGPPDCIAGTTGVTSGNHAIPFTAANFDSLNDETEYRDLVIDAIDDANTAGDILTTAADGGSSPATVALSNIDIITDTVGNPNWVTGQRCASGISCATDADCQNASSCNTTSLICD